MSYGVMYAIPFEILFDDSFFNDEIYDLFINSEVCGDFSESFSTLLKVINIKICFEWLKERFCDRDDWNNIGKGDVYVFFSPKKDNFLILDLYWGCTDQSNMIVLSVHINNHKENNIKEVMMNIYNDKNANPKSQFNEYEKDELLIEIDSSRYPQKCEQYYQNIFYIPDINS